MTDAPAPQPSRSADDPEAASAEPTQRSRRHTPLEEPRSVTWRRLRRMAAPRLTRANLLAGLLTIALGFAIATQIQQNAASGLQTLRQDELVRVLDDVSQRVTRLDQQQRELEAQRDALESGVNSSDAAVAQAQSRLDQLAILAGTVPARGPGIRLTITDPTSGVRSALLLDVLQELRDAGAEVVQVGSVRVVAESAFTDSASTVSLDGQPLPRPFVVLAIGNPQTLASAMNIPGGIVNTVARTGAKATVEQLDRVVIDALHTPRSPRYAQPAPEPTPIPTRP